MYNCTTLWKYICPKSLMCVSQFSSSRSDVHCGCADTEWTSSWGPALHQPLFWTPALLDKYVYVCLFLVLPHCLSQYLFYFIIFRHTSLDIHRVWKYLFSISSNPVFFLCQNHFLPRTSLCPMWAPAPHESHGTGIQGASLMALWWTWHVA